MYESPPTAAAPRVRFSPASRDFDRTLRARVATYFDSRALSRHADAGVIAKGGAWIGLAIALYLGLLLGWLPGLAVVALGFAIAQVGFNVGHDALHRAGSSHGWINTVLGWSFDVLGASSHAWRHAHNVVHHTYTNMPGQDHDIEAQPWMRFYAQRDVPLYYRMQHVFAFGFYTLTMLAWTFSKDFVQLSRPQARTGARTWAGVLLGKAVHLGLFVVVPLFVYDGPAWQVLLGYLGMQMAVGFTLAVVFQLAHVVEATQFPVAGADGTMARSWAEHQLHTTANFGAGMSNFFTGGLNHQIEHHLFPTISHAHYPALAAIVRTTAAEFGLPYHHSKSFWAALGSHVRTMRTFGRPAIV